MNDKQFDCFMQAATVLNFHRAAKDLFISQPTITYQIRSLEKELGFDLFERSGRNVVLTRAGESLYKSLIAIKSSFDVALEDAREAAAGTQGFSVTWPPAICDRNTVLKLVEDFSATHPGATMTIKVAEGEHPVQVQEENGVVLVLDKDASRYHNFDALPLYGTTIACVMSTSHPLSRQETVTWDVLQSQKVLLMPPDLYPNSYLTLLRDIQQHLPARNLTYLESEMGIDLNIAAGRGVGFRPMRNGLLGIPENGIVAVPLSPATEADLCIVYPTAERDGAMGEFAHFAHEFFAPLRSTAKALK